MSKSSVAFGAVGDISLGDHPLCVGFGADSTFKKHKPDLSVSPRQTCLG